MDYKDIKELIAIIDTSGLREFELRLDNAYVKMGKNSGVSPTQITMETTAQNQHPVAQPMAQAIDAIQEPTTIIPEDKPIVKEGKIITSPIVGTFYSSPSPSKPNFVSVGDRIKKGDVVCILEAMKIMNEIISEYDGEIVEILAVNEQMVEYNQPLYRII